MKAADLAHAEAALVRGPVGAYSTREISGLPDPVRRFFAATIAPGSLLAQSARIQMRGHIKVGRWLPFRALEVLSPHVGFLWAARAAGVITGSDRYVGGRGAMDWRLAGLVRVVEAAGPDVSRSAAERAAAEAAWVPTALLPRFGVSWAADGEHRLEASFEIDGHPIRLRFTLDDRAHIVSVVFDRWGDPDSSGDFGLHPFGGEFTSHGRFDGLIVPTAGRLGWFYGTDRWSEGEFFRYRITDLATYATASQRGARI